MSLNLIKNRPQFDLEVLKSGVAIRYKFKKEMFSVFKNAIIIRSELTKLFIVEYNQNEDYIDRHIYLNDVLSDDLEIEVLQ